MSLIKLTEGAGHEIFEDSENPEYLTKKPKAHHLRSFPAERVMRDLHLAEKHFGQWLPETTIHNDEGNGYFIRQERICEAQHINQALLATEHIRQEVEHILACNHDAQLSDNCGLDFLGLEGSAKCVLSHVERFRGGMIEKMIIKPGLSAGETIGKRSAIPFPPHASK